MDSLRKAYESQLEFTESRLEKLRTEENGQAALARIILTNMGGSDAIKVAYGKKVLEAGYNMSIDDYGAYTTKEYGQVNAPIIVYTSNDILKQVGSKKVSDLYISSSAKKVMEEIAKDKKKLYYDHVPNVLKETTRIEDFYGNIFD